MDRLAGQAKAAGTTTVSAFQSAKADTVNYRGAVAQGRHGI
jgi:hypothetical protein